MSYLVCANQRSGSTMLCRALADTGVVGRPDEYFLAVDESRQPGWRCWEDGPVGVAHGVADREEYLALVYRLGSTPNGVFGAKVMWNNLRWALQKFQELPRFSKLDGAQVFHTAFPDLRVVNVTRRDRVAQAVSWARMIQDGVWVVSEDEPAVPAGVAQYDFALISSLEAQIIEGERGWRAFYAELGVTPYEVVYEELSTPAGYEGTVRGILDHLDHASAAIRVPRPRTYRQAGDLTAAWAARYRAERATKRT
jgi:trehalose 2-sulfotransferase